MIVKGAKIMYLLIDTDPEFGGCNIPVLATSDEYVAEAWANEGTYRKVEAVNVVHNFQELRDAST